MFDNIRWLGHASFLIEGAGNIYVDPWKASGCPEADIILITHVHHDHCSPPDVAALSKDDTEIVTVSDCSLKLDRPVTVVSPGDSLSIKGIRIEAVHAYNLDKPFHPRDAGWLGFIIEVRGARIYHAGDTDFIPEMKDVKADVVLLPIGGTYTMNAVEAARAAEALNPKLAIPMHYGDIVGGKDDGDIFSGETGVPVKILTPER